MRTIAGHPVLRSCEVLRLFLTHPGDLSACPQWQQMLQHPATDAMKALLSGLGLGSSADSANPASSATQGAPGQQAAAAVGGAGGVGNGGGVGAAGGGGVGGGAAAGLALRVLRMKQSLKGVVQQKPRRAAPQLTAEEVQLRQAKEMFK